MLKRLWANKNEVLSGDNMSHSKIIDEIADELFKEVFGTETNPYYGKLVNDDVLTKELTDTLYELAKEPINIDEAILDKFNSIPN